MCRQLQDNLIAYNQRCSGVTDKDPLLALRIEQFVALRERVTEFERVLRFLRGEKVEPVAHEARAVLLGEGMQFTP